MFKNLFNKIKEIYTKFPIEISLIIIYSVYLIIQNNRGNLASLRDQNISKFVLYTFFLLIGFKYFFTSKVKYICSAVCLSIIFVFLSGTKGINSDLSNIDQSRSWLFGLLCFFLMIVIPFLKQRKEEKLNNYNLFLFKNLSLTGIMANILYVGFILILLLINYLFRELDYKIYFDIMVLSYLVFATFFMLSFYPDNMDNIETDNTKILKFLFLFIAIPLLAVYTMIVYSYFLKILIKMSIPKGEISKLILIHGIVTVIVILLIRGSALINDNVKRKIEKVFCITELPMILMLFIAIFQRIKQYGMTINRYAVVIFGLYLLIITVYILLIKKNKTFIIIGSFIIVLFFSIVGPLNIFAVPFYLQERRLEKLLTENSIGTDGKSDKAINETTKKDIKGIISYFRKWDKNSRKKEYDYDKIYENLKLDDLDEVRISSFEHYSFKTSNTLNIKGYDILIKYPDPESENQYKNYKFNISIENITIYEDSKKILEVKRKDIETDIVRSLKEKKISENIEITDENGEITDKTRLVAGLEDDKYSDLGVLYNLENEDIKISLLISQLYLWKNGNSELQIDSVLVKFKK
ncbi:DUF4153 domain-containing protein [Sebaldella sp. S0638]|uniref:DUF4153 domain-containing protein n=1 Tax=Sebaldella sp. S0638 TaxID=2957809 RepID=UPI0020A054AE|nr:DUF4153 domain-containing protein [Sebaldella sp. S0638]MCP1225840.1 DUF4153 domain-containing protein [Sebaldella sp. S0638]